MQFIHDVLKKIKNPFIVTDESGNKTMKWLDKWTEDDSGYQFKCEIDADGKLHRVAKSNFFQTDRQRAFYVWAPKIDTEKTFRKPDLEVYIYQENYKRWEGELEREYRRLGITEKQVRLKFDEDEGIRLFKQNLGKEKHVASVYLINMVGTSFYKIGVATNAKKRVKELQTGNPLPLEVTYEARVTDAYGFELALHKKFDDYRIQNEWFELTDARLTEVLSELKVGRLSA